MKQKLLSHSFGHFLNTATIAAALALTACGPQAFVPDTVVSNQTAGSMNLPPKVDIVFGLSDDGTMQNYYPSLSADIASFTSKLQETGWDYRFVSVPLSAYKTTGNLDLTNRVATSKYHTNYPQNQWIAPYPGATYLDGSNKQNPLFLLFKDYFSSYIVIPSLDTSRRDGRNNGFKNQVDFLKRTDVQTNFLREDALLAVMAVTTGRDWSDGYYTAWNGDTPYPVDVDKYVQQIQAVKKTTDQSRYYALVSHSNTSTSWSGVDYEKAAQKMSGISVDIINNSMTAALSAVATNLSSVKLTFKKNYLVLGTEPNELSIHVFKNNKELTKGVDWTYEGYKQDFDTIYYPVSMGKATGYFIKLLNTNAELVGSDTARVEYMNKGAVSSH